MAKKDFILQGFTAKTHKDALISLFDVEDIERVIVSVAFVNLGGVEQLEAQLKAHSTKTTAFIGIRNDITSQQGAKHLLDQGVTLYVVDTGSRRVIYHPKLYLVRGANQAKLIIGSANLTPGGLNNNIEAGIVVECDMQDEADRLLIESIERSLDEQPAEHPENVIRITSAADLDALHASGRLIDELATSPPRPASTASSTADDPVPKIKLKVAPIYSALLAAKKAAAASAAKAAAAVAPSPNVPVAAAAGLPTSPAAPTQPATPVAPAATPAMTVPPPATGVQYELVWESKELTRRDLDVPDGENTNRTGSINLDKGRLPEEVDHRHYFRDEVFDALSWSPGKNANVEEAFAKFQLVVKGISYGEFDLRIGHSTNTQSATYAQRNAMTRLSWGPVRDYVAKPDLIGRTLALYRDQADPKRFVLEID